jgi:Alginate export
MKPFLLLLMLITLCGNAFAREDGGNGIPGQVPRDHWSCREIAELCEKYGAVNKLPAGEVLERKELAASLLSLMEKALAKYESEGDGALPREDQDRIAALNDSLKGDLAGYDGYLTRREAIERMLARNAEVPFEIEAGIAGFLRGEGAGNFLLDDFSPAPGHGEGRFLYRVKPYLYWHPASWLNVHAEGQGYGFTGGGGQDFSRYAIYQGFAELLSPNSELVALKGGRQEFSYGSAFILGADTFFDGLSFDGGRLRVKPLAPLAIDILGGAYAESFSGGIEGELLGAYITYSAAEGSTVEVYAFRDTGSQLHHSGEYLLTWGTRLTGKAGPFSAEFEPVYESGWQFNATSGANERINAFGGHLDLGYEASLAGCSNTLFASFAYGSGSRDAAADVAANREFRTPNNNSSLVGDMHVIGDMSGTSVNGHHASGLQDYTLGWGIDFTREVNLSATGHYFIANATENGFDHRLGLETDFTLTLALTDNFSCIVGYDRFFTGNFFREASGSGKDIDYGYIMAQFDLSWKTPRKVKR